MQTESAEPGLDDHVARPRLDVLTYAGPTDLYAALARVRERDGAHDAAAWLIIERYVRRALPLDHDEDIRQNAMLAIVVHAPTLVAREPLGAHAWLHAICRSQLVNEVRRRHRMRLVSMDDTIGSQIVAPSLPRLELVQSVIAELDQLVVRHVRRRSRTPTMCARRIAQARAAIRRVVLEDMLPEITQIAPVPLPLLAKWVERGRTVVLDAIDAARVVDPDGADLFDPVAELMRKRRSDAGRPRPSRRKPIH